MMEPPSRASAWRVGFPTPTVCPLSLITVTVKIKVQNIKKSIFDSDSSLIILIGIREEKTYFTIEVFFLALSLCSLVDESIL
jgi:hypothetical protein